jgi:putative ABC transport system permease protein
MTDPDRNRSLPGADPERDVDDELSFHLEMRIRELITRGESPERARMFAMRRFGEYERSRDECVRIGERRRRRMSRRDSFGQLWQDVVYALRMLRRAPGFTLVAIATLALGIGANSTIFSVVQGVLLEDLPWRDADRLFEIRTLYPDGTGYSMSPPDFMSLRADTRLFDGLEAYGGGTSTLLGEGDPREVRVSRVSNGLFDLLGMTVAQGRGFLDEESRQGAGRVLVLDHGYWQQSMGGDSSILGHSLIVDGDPYVVVGVMSPGDRLPTGGRRARLNEADMYAPLEYDSTFDATTPAGRRGEYLRVVGRTRPGAAIGQATADLRRVGSELQRMFPQTNDGLTFLAMPMADVIIGDVRLPLLVLLGAVGFVLLVACSNVANLVLARASARQGEMAVRAALGAGRGRLVRQMLTESAILGLLGGIAGLSIAWLGTRALTGVRPADIPRIDEIGINGAVVLFTFTVALLTGLVFGAIPALQASARGPMGTIREAGRGAGGHRIRGGLVVSEMALAVVLLMGSGLLIRSFVELTGVAPGFEPGNAIALRLSLQGQDYGTGERVRDRVDRVLERIRSLPGVTAAAATTVLPLSGRGSVLNFAVDGPPPPPDVNAEIGVVSITPAYFEAMGMQLRGGRAFTAADGTDAPPVAVINEAAVRVWFHGDDPVGRRVTVGSANPEVIGVVADVLQRDPSVPVLPELFRPFAQRPTSSVRIVVRSSGDAIALAPSLRSTIASLDPDLPIADIAPLDRLVATSVARPRFYMSLLALFAAIALVLAATGIFGVMSYTVAQRASEIGVRMALGARAGTVARMIVGRAMLLTGAGAAIGISLSLVLARVLQSQLFGIAALDPIALLVVLLVLAVSTAAASYLPARRAARLDPATALRSD